MSVGDKAKHAVEDAKGKAKEAVGKATGDQQRQAEGRADQDRAQTANAVDKAKESVSNAGHEAKGKAKEVAGAVTDDERMEAKGKAEQLVAKGKEHLNK